MSTEKRKEYLKEYRKKKYKATNIDFKLETREKLDTIVKRKNTSIVKFLTDYIDEEYKRL